MYIQLAFKSVSRSEIDFVQKKAYNDTQSNIDFITTSTLFNVEPSKHRRILTSTLHVVRRGFLAHSSSLPFCPAPLADSLASVAGCTVHNVPSFSTSQRQNSSRSTFGDEAREGSIQGLSL